VHVHRAVAKGLAPGASCHIAHAIASNDGLLWRWMWPQLLCEALASKPHIRWMYAGCCI
jgi:hypothetical protein